MTGFTQFDNELLQKVLTSYLTKRQLKIILLIIRFSAGYQKSYAVLRKNDYAYAGVSQYCITAELKMLARKRVIVWIPEKDMVWVNPNLSDWAVEKAGDRTGDNLRRFFKISTKNSTKQQLATYQNSKYKVAESTSPYIDTKKSNKDKEKLFQNILKDYFLRIAPLSESEMFILRQVVGNFPLSAVDDAIDVTSGDNDRSFSRFLKALDGPTLRYRSRRMSGLRSGIARVRKRLSGP